MTRHLSWLAAVLGAVVLLSSSASSRELRDPGLAAALNRALAGVQYLMQQDAASFGLLGNSSDMPLSAAAAYLAEAKETLLNGLEGRAEFDALRAYVELRFPELDSDVVQYHSLAHPDGLVNSKHFAATRALVRGFVSKLQLLNPLAVTLHVSTTPSGASIVLKPLLGTSKREGTSDSDFPLVYRGMYAFTVSKPGFDTVSGELDLVDDRRDVLVCSLVPQDAAAEDEGACVRQSARRDSAQLLPHEHAGHRAAGR